MVDVGIPSKAWRGLAVLLLAVVCASCVSRPHSALENPGDVEALRREAHTLVNRERQERGLAPLAITAPLNAAAQAHAEDMARRNYYGHLSPERLDVAYRYRANGGGRWRMIGENIASCISCPKPATQERVRIFHQGWMDSPGHRNNILSDRIDGFGFGIAAANGRLYGVQTFVGSLP